MPAVVFRVLMVLATVALVLSTHISTVSSQQFAMVPYPLNVQPKTGQGFPLSGEIRLPTESELPDRWDDHLAIVESHLRRLTGDQQRFSGDPQASLHLNVRQDGSLADGGYQLEIKTESIDILAADLKGLAHATATWLQLVGSQAPNGSIKPMVIEDKPQLAYRSFLIDMGRNPHSVSLLKEVIDLAWYYKLDSLQLHLTDDQRFAFPSQAFPQAWDQKITLDEFKMLEAYAVARGVTLIPELEVPGHSGVLRSAYPDVFGESPADLATSPKALAGIKTLLSEMMEVFSSPYIHIGADEAFGVSQADQRTLINTLNEFLKSNGRQTVVWEGPGPGEGDNQVSRDVIHINWETRYYSPEKMLAAGYRVVNATWDPLYIVDHYPRINFTMTSPQYIYEQLRLTRFKSVDPGIATFRDPIEVERTNQLMGFCMCWWEGREENFLRMCVPRMIPYAEIAWNPEIERDFVDFQARVRLTEVSRRKAFYPVSIDVAELAIPSDNVFHQQTKLELNSAREGQIRYTLDGAAPSEQSPLFSQPLDIDQSTIVRAALFRNGEQVGHGSRRNLTRVDPAQNLALGKPVRSSVTSGQPFSVERLTDGGTDNLDFYLGYPASPEPISITIDLEQIQPINRIVVHAYTISGSFEKYRVEVSKDGERFDEVGQRVEKPEQPEAKVEHRFPMRDARFIRIISQGNHGYVFDTFSKLTEIQVFRDDR